MLSKSESYIGLWEVGEIVASKIIHFLEKKKNKKQKAKQKITLVMTLLVK